ncbi:hypothetical protein PHYPSEUDO_009027 [Phytophthora pseudosyringae]|uniref:Chromosome segregation in meiosis protein 3 domain-containing protein n=1 Tax=Phytophthora pseudosyringae TaxID=221518 RepID=A0A8T1VG56_9STRA|nr:hypothetical protein PHYPSEUDO_009027 [Phytophthora pseudosyringae]
MATRGWERDEDLAQRDDPGASTVAVDGAPASQDVGEGAGNAAAPVVPQKRRRNLLRESHLVSAEGLKKVHRTFPYQVSADVSGREAQALASLVKMYKQWAFDLYPGLNLEDFVERAETLGKGHQVQGLVTELREKERIKAVSRREEEEESDSDGEEAML